MRIIIPVVCVSILLAMACGGDRSTPDNSPDSRSYGPILDGGRSLAADLAAAINAGAAKEFPAELKTGSPEMPAAEVVRLWEVFLSSTYVVDSSGAVTEYCSDGTGARLGIVLQWINLPGTVFEEARTSGAFD